MSALLAGVPGLFATLVQGVDRLPSDDPSGTQWAYVWLGWGVAVVAVVVYAVVILLRGRTLSKKVPPEERRWM